MADPWFTVEQLRTASGARQAADQARLDTAAAVARREVRRLCGPVEAETITDRVRVRRASAEVPLKFRPTTLTSVTGVTGSAHDVTAYDFDGQVLFRKDGGLIAESLAVVYESGWEDFANIPGELIAMAELIGTQYLRVSRKFTLDGDDLPATGFLVPAAALEIAADYLLAPGGV